MVAEEGNKVEGKWKVVTTDETKAAKIDMKFDTVYEYEWKVKSILPGFLSQLRAIIISKVTQIRQEIKGLEVLWWKITDKKYTMQVKRKIPVGGNGTIKKVALSFVLVFTQGVFLAAGIWLVFGSIRELIKEAPEEIIPPISLWGTMIIGGIFLLIYLKTPKKTKSEKGVKK